MWATYVPILVFLGLSVLDSGPMYATDRRQTDVRSQTDVRQNHHLMPRLLGAGHNNVLGLILLCFRWNSFKCVENNWRHTTLTYSGFDIVISLFWCIMCVCGACVTLIGMTWNLAYYYHHLMPRLLGAVHNNVLGLILLCFRWNSFKCVENNRRLLP